ncbi:MAG: hypothetical protein K2N63_10400 [Lachnospiraceae bacterium]|nr:hypothetical protein [Lachnospiraceae bacterium]
MYSVTKRISMIKQPRGGYINKKELTITQLEDGITLNESENIHASLVGLAVDYMTRFMMGAEREGAFSISLKGAMSLDLFTADKKQSAMKNAVKLLSDIEGIDKKSITNACKLAGYDVCFRAGIMGYRPVEEINPDADTIENIMTMINRSISFWKEYGPITKDGFTFEGGYTDTISTGDGDYLAKDTLWDFKVSKDEPKPKYTLQLLVYYIMGMHSVHKEFKSIKNLGIYNPRMNKVYTVDIDTISRSVIDEVSKEVIGY